MDKEIDYIIDHNNPRRKEVVNIRKGRGEVVDEEKETRCRNCNSK